ncbi:MAG: radical SAM protein [Chitinivibrionales bacterium]|nr:radical SAM protein [Chitinivibrionales bacterium]
MSFQPAYTHLSDAEWKAKIGRAYDLATECMLCPRNCKINRLDGNIGFCRAPNVMWISSAFAHHGEEPCLSGNKGSGTIFFSNCTLKCVYCQNYQISHEGEGEMYPNDRLAETMLWLQRSGCHNINLVTPSHYMPWMLEAIYLAYNQGLNLPIVYNCSGYESVEVIDLLKDIVDIYLPDMKYADGASAKELSHASDYVNINKKAIVAMFRQTGSLRLDEDGIARRGLLIRHLVLPHDMAGSEKIVDFLQSTFDPEDVAVSVMAQYGPRYNACRYSKIARAITPEEYRRASRCFKNAGFSGYFQEMQRLNDSFFINFKRRKKEALTGDERETGLQ